MTSYIVLAYCFTCFQVILLELSCFIVVDRLVLLDIVQDRIEAQQIRIFELQHEQKQQDIVEKDLRRSVSSMWQGTIRLSLQLHHKDQTVQVLETQLAAARAATTAAEARYRPHF